ncbi:MAG: metal-dependent transcriptional regulator, partial [Myxococcota bacterium]|nr:metal-dependent transcriptional regulator [Myxococcota bacterium]
MSSPTVEDYVKHILLAQHRRPGDPVGMGQIASMLGVTPGTVTTMVKGMAARGLLSYEPYTGVELTEEGRGVAIRVLRRHRVLELFLVEVLELDWADVHEEAEQLEHAASDGLVERMAEMLGHPERDPHGDPIPSPDGELPPPAATTLATCALDEPMHVVRVLDQDPAFLRRSAERGLVPGVSVRVVDRDEVAGEVRVIRGRGESVTLS